VSKPAETPKDPVVSKPAETSKDSVVPHKDPIADSKASGTGNAQEKSTTVGVYHEQETKLLTSTHMGIGVISTFGTENEDVRRMQNVLWVLGYYNEGLLYRDISTGRFDETTLEALIRFQLTFEYTANYFSFNLSWDDIFDSNGRYYGCNASTSRMLTIIYNAINSVSSISQFESTVSRYRYVELRNGISIDGLLSLHPLDHVRISSGSVLRDDRSANSQSRFIWDYMAKEWHI